MIRHAAAVAVVLCLSPAWLRAQSTTLVVNAASANVHKTPSTGSLVVGQAPRGAVLNVTRELGSWVKVSWPAAPDGGGYVHLSMGTLTIASAPVAIAVAAPAAASRAPEPAAATATSARAASTAAGQPSASTRTGYVLPQTHSVGVGGLMGGSTFGYGATVRMWSRDRLGVQVQLSHYALTNPLTPDRVTSTQFSPSLLYSWRDRVTDYVWVRPYLGAGANIQHQTLSLGPLGVGGSTSDNSLGFLTFGGGEMTFASAPRFGLSVDLGYRWSRTPFVGYDLGGLGVAVSGHWYVK